MSKSALPCSAVMIAFLGAATAAQAQTHESAIPNLASAAFGWQHGFDGLNFQRVEGKVAPTGRGPVLPGIERLADDLNPNLTPWASAQELRRRPEIDESGRIVMSGGDSQRAERRILWVHDRREAHPYPVSGCPTVA